VTAREFLTNVTIILAVMATGALIETAVPMFAARPWKQGRRLANLGLTAVSFFSNWLLASLAATAALTLRPAGLMAQLQWPGWIEIVTGIIVLDFSVGYMSHRAMHMWPAMWRLHQIHHSDPFVDVTTTYRTHPVENRLLGTYTPADRAASVVYGLDDTDPQAIGSFPRLLSMPFQAASEPASEPDRKVRLEAGIGR